MSHGEHHHPHHPDGGGDDDYFERQSAFAKSYMAAPSSPLGKSTRTSFIPQIDSPGPAAYTPNVEAVKTAVPRPAFGTSNRHHESHRFVSELHNRSLPAVDTPGPGTYRVDKADSTPNSPKRGVPAFGFGTAQQRPETSGSVSPGAVYNQEPPKTAPAYSFAPHGSIELGMTRSRQDGSKMFLSKEHARVDNGSQGQEASMVGPGLYETSNQEVLSPKKVAARAVFGRSTRDVKDSMLKDQLLLEPLSTTACQTPGPVYEYPSMLASKSHKFGSSPRMYSAEKGPSSMGPYISRLHEESMRGACSPGPGTYDVQGGRGKAVPGLGDGPTFPFSGGPVEAVDGTSLRIDVPGPGTYNPKDTPASSSYSMGANLRIAFGENPANGPVPGPGAYNLADASLKEGQITKAPAFSMGAQTKAGRASFIQPTCTPGPVYSPQNGAIETSPKKGFSFGMKEKTKSDKSTVGFRYHGRLAANECLGTEGPGPIYDTSAAATKLSGKRETPSVRIGTASRDSSPRIYISRQHAEADGAGGDAPGPGTYDNHKKELASVTSRYRKPATAVFSTTQRFKSNYSTF